MSSAWQDIVAISLIAVATAYVIRRIWRAITGRQPPRCASCSVCSQSPNDRVLISIDPPKADPTKED